MDFFQIHQDMEGEIITYSQPLEVAEACKKERFDLYLLDIIMDGMSGIELGKKIREEDQEVPIIYTTSSREFAFEAYGVHALFYLEKPLQYEQVEEALEKSLEFRHKRRKDRITINARDGVTAVNSNDIMYIENVSRTVVYYLKDGREIVSVCLRKSFEQSLGSIPRNSNFIHPHKSFFVNMQYIRLIQQNRILLDSGKEVPISRKNNNTVKKIYLNYMAGGMENE